MLTRTRMVGIAACLTSAILFVLAANSRLLYPSADEMIWYGLGIRYDLERDRLTRTRRDYFVRREDFLRITQQPVGRVFNYRESAGDFPGVEAFLQSQPRDVEILVRQRTVRNHSPRATNIIYGLRVEGEVVRSYEAVIKARSDWGCFRLGLYSVLLGLAGLYTLFLPTRRQSQ
ncbi:MAG: hypothetical protein HRU11_12025 [Parvularculaceae bacterium]|nr:hypothetical protein [Parvularculaceae bacterium]